MLADVESSFVIPGTLGPKIVVRRSMLGGVTVEADGQPVKRRRGRTLTYEIPLTDGTTRAIELKGQYSGLRAVVDGTEIPLEPKLRPWELLLVVLPFGLVVGGAIGGVIGAIGFVVNSVLVRTSARTPVKVVGMLGVAAIAGLIWFGIAFFLAPLPTLTAGTCLSGVHEGATVTSSTARPIACTSPHENEVVATFDYPGGGAFPGDAAFQAFAETNCIPAFGTYVGIDFESSSLNMIFVAPTNDTWLKGDRQVACVTLTADGSLLSTSVKGSAR
jgi:hypothetical protein